MAGGLLREGGDEGDTGELAEINVTPFIDVMLVLLIIFMVAAPLATVDVKVDLPSSNAPAAPRPDKPTYVTVQPDLSTLVGDDLVAPDGLAAALRASTGGDPEARVFLRADKSVPYGDLMGVMNRLRDSGFPRIALVGLESVPGGGGATAPGGSPAVGAAPAALGGATPAGGSPAVGAAPPALGGATTPAAP